MFLLIASVVQIAINDLGHENSTKAPNNVLSRMRGMMTIIFVMNP